MVTQAGDQDMIYDRQLLLAGAKRNAVLELWEVQRYGIDSYGDADYVSIYGMPPAVWHSMGIRLLGRTAVECTRDELGGTIARDVASIAASASHTRETLVVDLFAGSGNTLYWLLRHLPGARALGFELDAGVFDLTRQNLAALTLDIDILNTDYVSGLASVHAAHDQLLVMFIAPPWGTALSKTSGLDLRRTEPPIADIVDLLLQKFPHSRILFAIQVYETVDPVSLAELQPRFDWSALRIYGLNAPGQNHGVLLGTRRWSPKAAPYRHPTP
jgi:hypothetical protein